MRRINVSSLYAWQNSPVKPSVFDFCLQGAFFKLLLEVSAVEQAHQLYDLYTQTLLQLLSLFSRVRLCRPMDCSPPGSPVHGILQARELEWGAIPPYFR